MVMLQIYIQLNLVNLLYLWLKGKKDLYNDLKEQYNLDLPKSFSLRSSMWFVVNASEVDSSILGMCQPGFKEKKTRLSIWSSH